MSQGDQMFGRVVTLQVGDRLWEDLRVTFDVQRTARSKPNRAEVIIYGLSQESRLAISEKLTPVRLVAGYSGTAGAILTGQLDAVQHERKGTDWQSQLFVADGRGAFRAYTGKAWRRGTPWSEVVTTLGTAMGLSIGPASLAAIQGSARGTYVCTGFAAREMDVLMADLGLQWSIQNGALQVVQADKALTDGAIVLTPESGLIGTPKQTDPKIGRVGRSKTKRKRSAIELDALLLPEYTPGRLVRVRSLSLTGDYRIDSVQFKGDSHGGQLVAHLACSAVTTQGDA